MKSKKNKRGILSTRYIAVFLIINLLAVLIITKREQSFVAKNFSEYALESQVKMEAVMENYRHSFALLQR